LTVVGLSFASTTELDLVARKITLGLLGFDEGLRVEGKEKGEASVQIWTTTDCSKGSDFEACTYANRNDVS
jgi:hypothetical protein